MLLLTMTMFIQVTVVASEELAVSPSYTRNGPRSLQPPVGYCNPANRLDAAMCANRISICKEYNVDLKWTGMGCTKKKNGKVTRYGDGGCQCSGYCGYHCRPACERDPECKWLGKKKNIRKKGMCVLQSSQLPTGPILQCPPRNTTPPTQAPTQCAASGNPCEFDNPGACCSFACMSSPSGPVCV